MRTFLLIAILFGLTVSGAQAQTDTAPAPEKVKDFYSLLGAENSFVKLCASEGMWPAFLSTFSSNVLTFPNGEPIAVGTKYMQTMPPSEILLTWKAAKAEVARSGDWGFTTGPWQIRPHLPTEPEMGSGSYIIVWTKDESNNWKVSLDMATDAPGDYTPIELKRTHQDPLPANLPFPMPNELRAADQTLFAVAGVENGSGYSDILAPDVILYRNDAYPVYGIPATVAVLQAYALKEAGRAKYAGVAASGDYGFTAGTVRITDATARMRPFNYLHIWRRTPAGDWRLVLEMTNSGSVEQTAKFSGS